VGFPDAVAALHGDDRSVGGNHGAAVDLDELTVRWQWALDAGGRALEAATPELQPGLLGRHRYVLQQDRAEAAGLLTRVAVAEQTGLRPWLAPVQVTTHHLGLPPGTEACLFDLDGVLTDSNVLHALAWGHVLDDVLLRVAQETGRHFVPFDPVEDYRTHLDGRPRVEGVQSFLASRGLRLPAGAPEDPADAWTVHGVATHKGEALERLIHRRGVSGLPGARSYLLAAAFGHLRRGVVSASTTTLPMLELAQLATLVETRVDADVMATEQLRSRPAPDLLLAACDRLEVSPERTVTLTHSAAGIAAARVGGLTAIGVATEEQAALLEGLGASRVVPSLGALLDPRLDAGLNGHATRFPVLVSR
jgi:beta-phosphoglucomutase-like phosphatase (HAD superfamily)